MFCGGFQPGSLAEYYYGNSFVPCRVLYAYERLAFVRFKTADWPGYQGYGNYTTAGIFAEHLRPVQQGDVSYGTSTPSGAEGKGQGIVYIASKSRVDPQPQVPRSSSPQPESKPQASPPAVAKPVQPKDVRVVKFSSRSPAPVRSISGLTLRDFLGNR